MTTKNLCAALKRAQKNDGRAYYGFPSQQQVSAMFAVAHQSGDVITNNDDGASSSRLATQQYVDVFVRSNNLKH